MVLVNICKCLPPQTVCPPLTDIPTKPEAVKVPEGCTESEGSTNTEGEPAKYIRHEEIVICISLCSDSRQTRL